MLRFAAHSFVNMCVALADVERVAQQRQGDVVGPDFDIMEGNLRTIIERCRTVSGMPQSVTYAERVLTLIKDGTTYKELAHKAAILGERIEDELQSVLCLYIPLDRVAYFVNAEPFGADFVQAFPSAAFDVEEAAKCLACARPTAAVFHLMRVM